MDAIALDNIPFRVDFEVLLKRLHVEKGSPYAEEVISLAGDAEEVGKPKALYKIAFIESRGEDWVNIEDVVFMTLGFKNGVIAHVHISWLDPNKVRKMTIVGTKRMIVYDDTSDYKIQIYDKGIEKIEIGNSLGDYDSFGKFQLIHRAGDLLIPKIDFVEPLETEVSHFIDCIRSNKTPITDGRHGLMVTRVLETGMKSLASEGKRIYIDSYQNT